MDTPGSTKPKKTGSSSTKRKPTVASVGLSLGSALGAAAMLYVWLPLSIALFTCAIVIIHELGHGLLGSAYKAEPSLPYFIPIGVGVIGLTRIYRLPELSKRMRRYLFLAGPVAGITAILQFAGLAGIALLGNTPLTLAVVCTLLWEAYGAILGADARKGKSERTSRQNRRMASDHSI